MPTFSKLAASMKLLFADTVCVTANIVRVSSSFKICVIVQVKVRVLGFKGNHEKTKINLKKKLDI